MKTVLYSALTLSGYAVITALGASPPAYRKTSNAGTWTYYSTSTVVELVPTLTTHVTLSVYIEEPTTTGTETTVTTTSYDALMYETTTTTSTYAQAVTTVFIDSVPLATVTTKPVSLPCPSPLGMIANNVIQTPKGFTPILSQFPYTASLEVSTSTTTSTQPMEGVTAIYDLLPAQTVTYTLTYGAPTITQTISRPGTFTSTSTHVNYYGTISTSTVTRTAFATQHAICNEDSGNCK